MINNKYIKTNVVPIGILLVFLFYFKPSQALNKQKSHVLGHIELDSTWKSVIYLSLVPTFDNMHSMSQDMIIAKSVINDSGNYSFDMEYLPKEDHLFRLHLVKKGSSPNSLIIGGNDENHLFLILNGANQVSLNSTLSTPPFTSTSFQYSEQNVTFQKVTDLVRSSNSIASESSQSKREFMEYKLDKELLKMADTCSDLLISLYALYQRKHKITQSESNAFYKKYLNKWGNNKSLYFTAFREKMPKDSSSSKWAIISIIAVGLMILSFFAGRIRSKNTQRLLRLSIQERKILKMLQDGASNQEISSQYNIGLSTVKSHVSSIFTKLKVKSRKELLQVK